ncbi:endoribonuclease ZC3H12A [Melanotaenia boesemani]|uniref:endoribonuclease ZC3H12A n=1 Tax=Melanotaenia boesemani TaxID=1250792 RepID=UPI001C03C25F|nr:endoribonuclease ZC3H12A [Melanotaenia boesemani]
MDPDPDPWIPGPPDPRDLPESRLDFFHKLGYSTSQVQAVQLKFGPNVDTDKVLGELVRIGASREDKQGPVTTMSVLVPRGDTPFGGPEMLLPLSAPSLENRERNGDADALRAVVIDGSNVAMSHGNKEVFSCLGIQLAVNFFLDRGHTDVTVFVPLWRKEQPRPDVPITDQHILRDLERRKILVFTPSRRVAGKRVVCNDDCFIVKHAFESDGIIVSNDMYRDLQGEKPEWKRFIDERLLMYSFVSNKFMPPDDPLGRHGPTLENFLQKFPKTQRKQLCPYGKKCTYGIKCKFHHPERAKQSNRALAGELRQSVHHPPTSQKQASTGGGPAPGLMLANDLAKKLTLLHESSSMENNKHVAQVKGTRRSSKRTPKKAGQHSDHASKRHGGSQEQLDSGLGSIDSQPLEAGQSLCDQLYGPSYRSIQQHYCPSRASSCSCCSQGPPSLGCTPSFHPDFSPYGLPRYPGSLYPVSRPAYSQPADFQNHRVRPTQQQPHWSNPFIPHPLVARSLPKDFAHQDHPPGPTSEEREVVRKKLLAIFSAQLVDTAMDMFPEQLDPQMLVAKILMLQGQNLSLR